jgi:hypothetical protein
VRYAVLFLIAAIGLTAPAEAQTRFAAPHPQPNAESTAGLKEVLSASEALMPGYAANAQSRARMDKFNRRIADRGNRAIRSVCVGCATTETKAKWKPRRIEANAEATDLQTKDPAQAPVD